MNILTRVQVHTPLFHSIIVTFFCRQSLDKVCNAFPFIQWFTWFSISSSFLFRNTSFVDSLSYYDHRCSPVPMAWRKKLKQTLCIPHLTVLICKKQKAIKKLIEYKAKQLAMWTSMNNNSYLHNNMKRIFEVSSFRFPAIEADFVRVHL